MTYFDATTLMSVIGKNIFSICSGGGPSPQVASGENILPDNLLLLILIKRQNHEFRGWATGKGFDYWREVAGGFGGDEAF